jgi:hypothetical protein
MEQKSDRKRALRTPYNLLKCRGRDLQFALTEVKLVLFLLIKNISYPLQSSRSLVNSLRGVTNYDMS